VYVLVCACKAEKRILKRKKDYLWQIINGCCLLLSPAKVNKDHVSFKDDAHVLTAGGVLRESFEMLVIVNLVNGLAVSGVN
jgi:hypothetical protein